MPLSSAATPAADLVEEDVPTAIPVPEAVQQNTMVSAFQPPPAHVSLASAILECAICLEPFAGGQAVRTLPCMHRFHTHCADRWLARHPKCPSCRFPVVTRPRWAVGVLASPPEAPITEKHFEMLNCIM